jgi:hypothetical protein
VDWEEVVVVMAAVDSVVAAWVVVETAAAEGVVVVTAAADWVVVAPVAATVDWAGWVAAAESVAAAATEEASVVPEGAWEWWRRGRTTLSWMCRCTNCKTVP